MSAIIDVTRLEFPARAWRVRLAAGVFVSCRAYPGKLTVLEAAGERMVRTDINPSGDIRTQEYETGRVIDHSGRGVELLAVGNNAACIVNRDGQLWLCREGECVRVSLDGRCVNGVAPRSDYSVEIDATTSKSDRAYHRYAVGPGGATLRGKSRMLAPIESLFDFPEASIEIFNNSDLVSPSWGVSIQPRAGSPRSLGELLEISSMLWFDGWLVIRDDIQRTWAVPISRDWIIDRMVSSVVPAIAIRAGVELVWGGRKIVRQVSKLLDGQLDGWTLHAFSRYSTRLICGGDQGHTRMQWTCLDSNERGTWDFSHPHDAKIVLDPRPLH